MSRILSEGAGRPAAQAIPRIARHTLAAFFARSLLMLAVLIIYCSLQQPAFAAVPQAGEALKPQTMTRLLLTAATKAGKRLVAVGEHGYIIYSDDEGASWLRAKAPRNGLLTGLFFTNEKNGVAVGHDGLILASEDSGSSWVERRYKPDEQKPLLNVWFRDAAHGYAIGAYGLFLETADGGKTWNERKITPDDKHLNAMTADQSGRLAIAAEAGTLLISADQGQNWTVSPSPYKGSFFGILPLKDGGLLAFGLRGKIFKSSDGGANWVASSNDSTLSLMGGTVLDDGRVLLVGIAGAILVSSDQGASFTRQAVARPIAFSNALALSGGRALLVGEAGVMPFPAATK